MKLKRIAILKRITIISIVLWVVFVWVLFRCGNISTISEGAVMVTGGVSTISAISYFLDWIFDENLKKINKQLLELYYPYRKQY
jgi:nicotinamide riboside transporter PnuC